MIDQVCSRLCHTSSPTAAAEAAFFARQSHELLVTTVLTENVAYSLVQVAHNFGAAAVFGSPTAVLLLRPDSALERRMAWITLIGWLIQAGSGISFGVVSYTVYGEFPDLHAIAVGALVIKVLCALGGIASGIYYFRSVASTPATIKLWRIKTGLGATALTAAAVLRWFS